MDNIYQSPSASLTDAAEPENTSGMGKGHPIPDDAKGWCWGGFLLGWIWGIGNRTWISFLVLLPYVGFVMYFVLGAKGREWAWQNKRWNSVEHFNRVQKTWSIIGTVLALVGLGVLLIVLNDSSF